MKKIMITGMSSANVRGVMSRTNVHTQSFMYRLGLVNCGYDVTNTAVDKNDPSKHVDEYDEFLIGLAPLGSIVNGHRLQIFALIGLLVNANKLSKATIFIDDWQFQSIAKDIKKVYEDSDKLDKVFERDLSINRISDQFYNRFQKEIKLGLEVLYERQIPLLASITEFGIESYARFYHPLSNNITFIDPSCYQPIPNISSPFKAKQWAIAGLADYSKYWQKLGVTWPVRQVGKKIQKDELSSPKFQSQKEEVVFQLYAQSKGILIPDYGASKTSWWRPRYLFAKHFKCVLYASPGSTGIYDIFNQSPREIERMENSDLNSLIKAQAETLDSIVWSEERFLETLDKHFQ